MHAVELLRQGHSLAIELADPVLDPLEAVTPLLLFLESEEHAGGVHRSVTPEVRHYLTMTCPFSSFLRLGSRDHVPKEVEEVHRLIHEILGDSFARIDTEHKFEVVDLPDADEVRDGPMCGRLADPQLSDQILAVSVRGERDHVAAAFQLLLRDRRHFGLLLLFCHRGRLRPAPSGSAVIKTLETCLWTVRSSMEIYTAGCLARPRGLVV